MTGVASHCAKMGVAKDDPKLKPDEEETFGKGELAHSI